MRLQKRALSKVTLANLLRRKKTNLKRYIEENGIVTYELLTLRCNSMGALPPTEDEFKVAKGLGTEYDVSSPTEGIVVMPPLPEPSVLVQEKSGDTSLLEPVQFPEDEMPAPQIPSKALKDKPKKKS